MAIGQERGLVLVTRARLIPRHDVDVFGGWCSGLPTDRQLVGTVLGQLDRAARIDNDAQGSDHQPVWVELEL